MNPVQGEILVIDGDERAQTRIGKTLAEQGFTVTAVGDGSAALCRIEAKHFALVGRRDPSARTARWHDHNTAGESAATRAQMPVHLWVRVRGLGGQ